GELAERCARVARPLFAEEIAEQVLADGGHFELSPMYHCIVLHRVLEMEALGCFGNTTGERRIRERMRDFLRRVICPDGEIPLVGDAARNTAPPAAALCAGVTEPLPRGIDSLADSGLHVFRGDELWAIFDAGRVCPDCLPGHGQADTLTVEVWFGGRRIVADPGVAEYTGPERAWGRSSR